MKTLLVMATHFIDENVISEYRKMKNTPNVDAVLMIDNTNLKFDFKSRVENRIFFGTSCKCFFFDSVLHEEMQLPYNGEKDFGGVMWHNGDYRFYYLKKFFPDYDYYWLLEYDVFCNAETYEGFLDKFKDNRADLLMQNLEKGKESTSSFLQGIDWIYNDFEKVYQGIFAVVRLSARAADFLYKRRLEQKEIFQNSTDQNNHWIHCEIFAPTELINNGFICEKLNEERVKFLPQIYLNDERIFLKPDNHLYHPVKSVKAEISKLRAQYHSIFFYFRKNFFTSLVEKLNSIPAFNAKNLSIQIDKEFNSMVINLSEKTGGGGLRCETWFVQEKLHAVAFGLYAAIVFEGEYLKYFKILEQNIDFSKMHSMQILENSNCKMLAYATAQFDNVSQVANIINILIKITFTILREKIYENN